MFLHLYGIGYSRFRRLKEHYQEHGIFPRIHGNTKRVPGNATSEKSLEAIHAFIENYVEENALYTTHTFTYTCVIPPLEIITEMSRKKLYYCHQILK